MDVFDAVLAPRMSELPKAEGGDYRIFRDPIEEPYRTRRFAVGELLYQSIDVPRANKKAAGGAIFLKAGIGNTACAVEEPIAHPARRRAVPIIDFFRA